jgi:hypothetical protein
VLRGVFVRDRLMCQPAPAPPPNVDSTPPDPDPNASARERFNEHTADPACGACHSLFDDLGFALENYDQIGRYRAMDGNSAIDTSGAVVSTIDKNLEGEFGGPNDLATRFAASPQIEQCVTTQWYRYATGRVETEGDGCSILQAHTGLREADGDLKALIRSLALSDGMLYRAPWEEEGGQ